LNTLRSETREVEIAAYKAFSLNNGDVSRPDIITSLNRLNSCFYIMIFENIPADYKPRPSGI
jgi:ethanolamine utilization cobalamin adenosyltransferase